MLIDFTLGIMITSSHMVLNLSKPYQISPKALGLDPNTQGPKLLHLTLSALVFYPRCLASLTGLNRKVKDKVYA